MGVSRARPSLFARRRAERRRPAVPVLLAALAGVIVGYVLPRPDRAARHIARRRVRSAARGGTRAIRVHATRVRGRTRGVLHRLRAAPPQELDDAELAHKVESIVFRDPRVPKARISINAEGGVVFLRGEVESPTTVADVGHAVAAVGGVQGVENLLHLPGTPAPHPRGGARLRAHQASAGD